MIKMNKKWENTIYFAIFALIVVFLFESFIFDSSTILGDQHSDRIKDLGIKQPFQTALQEQGEFSVWNPSVLGGMPLIDATAGDIVYPLSIPFYYVMPLVRSEGFKMIMHVFFAGVAMFLMLAYSFKTTKFTAFIGGVFYMLNPQFLSHVMPGHDGKMFVIAWLPLIIWALRSLMEKPTILKTTLLAAAISMSIYTSHIQMTYFLLWGLFAYWVYISVFKYVKEKSIKSILPQAAGFWSAVVLALILGGIQLYPAFSFVQDGWSVRGETRGIDFVASWSLHWPEFLSLWVPDFGNWLQNYWSENHFKLNTEYVGAVATLLAVMALITRPTGKRFFWFGVGAFAVLMSMGIHTPVLRIAYYIIPGVNKFRAISMIMFWFAFATVLLACYFVKDICSGYFKNLAPERIEKIEKATYILIGVSSLAFLIFQSQNFVYQSLVSFTASLPEKENVFRNNFSQNFVPALYGWFAIALTVLISFLLVIKNKLSGTIFLGIVLLLSVIDTVRVNKNFIRIENNRQYTHVPKEIEMLREEMKEEPFRVFFLPGVSHIHNVAGMYNLEGLGGFHDNELRWYREFRGQGSRDFIIPLLNQTGDQFQIQAIQQGHNKLNVANCKYVIARSHTGFLPIKNENYIPRLSFVTDYKVLSESEAQVMLRNSRFDSRRTVILETSPSFDPVQTEDLSIDVQWISYTPNKRVAKVTVPREGLLRISEVYYPGWTIKVNGEEKEVYKSDISWMSVHVDGGEHLVEMRVDSLYLSKIMPFSVITMSAILIFWAVMGVKYIKKKKATS
ncbi:hypothetical protein CHISP_3126 [Chitinispirillum alkaliphilum]|nr:hypothetical protein CHISP_3126 [Chitinispirillum alkaliphilum]